MNPLILVLLVTIAVGAIAAFLAWRERSQPGATPLVVMLAGQCWWSAFLIFQLQAETLEAKLLWVNLSWIGVVVIPVAWLLFALAYTGRDQYLRPRYVALLSIVPAITVIIAMTGEYHDLLYVESALVERGGRVMLAQTGGPWFWLAAGYTYLLGLLGSIPLLGLVRSDAVSFRGQGVALLVGTLAPWASNALFLAGAIPSSVVDPTPIAFSISGVAYFGALTRFRLFGTSPSPNRRARRIVFERMHEGAIVVDNHDNVVDMNENVASILDVAPREALGSPASEVVPGYDQLPVDGKAPDYVTIGGDGGNQFYDVTSTRIGDLHGRTIGRVITFHDVGDYLRQQQRLEVLNRVLRHNIRTETNLISGYADLIGEGDVEDVDVRIKEHARRIEEMGEMAREIADLFEREGANVEAVSLDELFRESVESVRASFPRVTVDCEPIPDDASVASVLRPVLSNLLENAAEHNTSGDPYVRVRIERDGKRLRVRVEDNGPGITEYERSVMERGTETKLEHGSGLGLWLIKWGAEIAGGTVTFEENEPTGSIVTVDVPVLSSSNETIDEPEPIVP